MTAADFDATLASLSDRLREEPGDRTARLILADLLEDDGRPKMAAVQRRLAEEQCYRYLGAGTESDILDAYFDFLDVDERPEAEVVEEFDEDLLVGTFYVRVPGANHPDDTIEDVTYVISAKSGDLDADRLRRDAGL